MFLSVARAIAGVLAAVVVVAGKRFDRGTHPVESMREIRVAAK